MAGGIIFWQEAAKLEAVSCLERIGTASAASVETGTVDSEAGLVQTGGVASEPTAVRIAGFSTGGWQHHRRRQADR